MFIYKGIRGKHVGNGVYFVLNGKRHLVASVSRMMEIIDGKKVE